MRGDYTIKVLERNNTLGVRGPRKIIPERSEGISVARYTPRVLSVIMPDAN